MIRDKRRKILLLAAVLVLAMVLGCTGALAAETGAGSTDFAQAQIQLTPASAVYTGSAVVPKVTVTLGGNLLQEGTDYMVSIPEMKEAGTYMIGVAGMGKYSGAQAAAFTIEPLNLTGTVITATREITTADLDAAKRAVKPEILGTVVKVTQNGTDITGRCTLTSAASVTATGGSVSITAAITDGDGSNAVTSTVNRSFTMKTHMSDCVIDMLGRQIYSGQEVKPDVKVLHCQLPYTLDPKTDYYVTYTNNVNAGFAAVTVTGMGNFTGSISRYFEIEPKDLFNCTVFYSDGRERGPYTGKTVDPAVVVRDGPKTVLVKNVDYTVNYTDANGKDVLYMRDIGKYKVLVTGMGNYTGRWTLNYEISGTDISGFTVELRYPTVKADGIAKIPEITAVRDGVFTSLLPADYDISVLDAAGNPVTELVNPGKYTVVVTGKNSYAGTATTTFEIVGVDQDIYLEKTSYKAYKKTAPFTLNPSSDYEGAKFTYKSSNPSVASVSETGKITIHKLGRAVITVSATGSEIYNPATKNVEVKVYPNKVTLNGKLSTSGGKKTIQVRWDTQDDVTYYQVRYSRNKDFKSGTYNTKKVTASTKGYKTQSTKLTGLKSGQKYYVKVCAVKTVKDESGKTLYYYGTWSGWKSVTVK